MLASLGWQNIAALLAGAGVVVAATVGRNTWRRRRAGDPPTETAATAPRARRPGIQVDWGRLRLWHVVLVVVFVFSLVVIVTTKNSDNRQGAWGLLGLVVGAVLPKGA